MKIKENNENNIIIYASAYKTLAKVGIMLLFLLTICPIKDTKAYNIVSDYYHSFTDYNNNIVLEKKGIIKEVSELDSINTIYSGDLPHVFSEVHFDDDNTSFYCVKKDFDRENLQNKIGSTYKIKYLYSTNIITDIQLVDEDTLGKMKNKDIEDTIRKTDDSVKIEGYL